MLYVGDEARKDGGDQRMGVLRAMLRRLSPSYRHWGAMEGL